MIMSKEYKSYSMELAGRTLRVDIGRVAKQANGAAYMHYGDTVVLSQQQHLKTERRYRLLPAERGV